MVEDIDSLKYLSDRVCVNWDIFVLDQFKLQHLVILFDKLSNQHSSWTLEKHRTLQMIHTS